METYLLDWANLLLRWLHLITGIAWIGASFYFVMLDNSLRPPKKAADGERGVHGELWAVHGGGFYCSQKFLTGPRGEPLTDDLHWSKWEAYTTWLSGMSLLVVMYWIGASTYLIDTRVMALGQSAAVGISVAFLATGWLFYDTLCKALFGRDGLLAVIVFLFVVLADWLLHQVFSARGAYIHVGAMLGTMMVANVFFHIIPGQRRMVVQIRAGQPVDPRPGQIGKQRSVHNTYFTLPVLFIMISNHYPMTYSHANGWLVLVVMMLAGVLIRQFFVLRHRGQVKWWLPVAGVALIATLIVLMAPRTVDAGGEQVSLDAVRQVVAQRCLACHSEQPTQPGFAQPPKGVVLQSPAQIEQHAAKMAETVASGYMPLGNLTGITDAERQLIARWHAQQSVPQPSR
ncbi:hypothetical protein GCM10007933_25820 [Zoogloea oryzae]|uniref:Haem-binding domain-containing protein n=1 Tax=Zoogloea oryzae TaxID=310767 RepID=A0ABQ6FDQ3_9RHOO|nr:urate hydroxylase PuuD [Zoogloea oryzae]GLT23119.1 hypothetical protein GCM10007933_25820 [Zoogloea oryzae]